MELEKLYDNPFDDEALEGMKDDEFDEEVNNLIEWCEDLDYEKYVENWHDVATSNKAQPPQGIYQTNQFKITEAELGGFSFEPNPEIMAFHQELGGNMGNFGITGQQTGVTQQMIDQNIAQIQREQIMQNQVQQQMMRLNADNRKQDQVAGDYSEAYKQQKF